MRTSKGGGRPNKGHTNGGAVSHPPRVPSPTATQSNSCTRWTDQRLSQSNTPSIYTDRYTYKDADKDTDTDTGVELLTFGSTTLRLRFIQTDTKMETATATGTDESMRA